MPNSILLVEDSEEYRKVVTRALFGHQVTCVEGVDEALALMAKQDFDLILLDLGLPKKPGFSLLSEMQADPRIQSIPVLCLTGKKEVADKVTAFSLGAEDYIVKPFDPIELKARVEAKVRRRRAQEESSATLAVGDLEINQSTHRVSVVAPVGRTEVPLTQTEFKLLCCLARRPDQVFTRDQLLVAAWGEDADVLDRAVDVHICGLRKKLGERGRYIRAVTGTGYKFVLDSPGTKKAA